MLVTGLENFKFAEANMKGGAMECPIGLSYHDNINAPTQCCLFSYVFYGNQE